MVSEKAPFGIAVNALQQVRAEPVTEVLPSTVASKSRLNPTLSKLAKYTAQADEIAAD